MISYLILNLVAYKLLQLSDGNFHRESAALDFVEFDGRHTYNRIAELLESIYLKNGINSSALVATVSDNG